MKDFIRTVVKSIGVVIGGAAGIWDILKRPLRFWTQRTPPPEPEPRPKPMPQKDPPMPQKDPPMPQKDPPMPYLLLTCFEHQQKKVLQALQRRDPGITAFDTVVCLQEADGVIYLTPGLLDLANELTWTVLRMASGTAEDAAVLLQKPNGEKAVLSPKDLDSLRETTCYFGIDLAMIPLSGETRTEIRMTLQRLQDILGPRLHLLKIGKDVVDGWPSEQRERRFAIWNEIFNGFEIRTLDNP